MATETIEKCECGKDASFTSYVHQPFDDEKSEGYAIHFCQECYDMGEMEYDSFYCQHCGRQIWETNGMRCNWKEFHWAGCIPEYGCVKCWQEIAFEQGQDRDSFEDSCGKPKTTIDGDFFSYEGLEKHGFALHEGAILVRSTQSITDVNEACLKLIDDGFKVIVDIEANGMGLEGYVGIWKKK